MIIAIDIGTTNLKTGLYEIDGTLKSINTAPMKQETENGISYFNPDLLWNSIAEQIKEMTEAFPDAQITAIGITSMAESGLLIDKRSGEACTKILPWFETASMEQAKFIDGEIDEFEQFVRTGLHTSYKYGLSKLLWLKDNQPERFQKNATWISVSSYIAYRLTSQIAEEKTLAVRTFAYDIKQENWNYDLIRHFGLNPDIFPDLTDCTTPVGHVSEMLDLGLGKQTKVYIAGHDHLAASLSIGKLNSNNVFNSIGTAETLIGIFPKRELTKMDKDSGLTFGVHPLKDSYYWMGGHSSSGGSIEWIRSILSDSTLSYEAINSLLQQTDSGPTGILYYPYLNGSGAPCPNPDAEAAFIGMTKKHRKNEILKAVLEGNAYQMELIRKAAAEITESKVEKLLVVGGGTRNKHWMQIKSNVAGVSLEIPLIKEAALKGAMLAAAAGEGYYGSLEEASTKCAPKQVELVHPDINEFNQYQDVFQKRFEKMRKLIL